MWPAQWHLGSGKTHIQLQVSPRIDHLCNLLWQHVNLMEPDCPHYDTALV